MKNSSFRHWLQEKWYEHVDECNGWNTQPYSNLHDYFGKYKWWLKREFKHQLQREKERDERRAKHSQWS